MAQREVPDVALAVRRAVDRRVVQDGRELGFPEMRSPAGSAAGNLPMHTLRFGYFLSDCSHERSGTVECIRGSHRTMRNTCEALG